MKYKLPFFVCATFSVVSALAADQSSPGSNADMATPRDAALTRQQMTRLTAPIKVSELIGTKIENHQQQKVGVVKDLAVDLQAGLVLHVIISSGGFLSMGEKIIAVPPGQLNFDAASKSLSFDITPEKLRSAPSLDMEHWADFYRSDRLRASYRYYGQETAFDALPDRRAEPNGLGYVERASKLLKLEVKNLQDEKIGSVENLIVDLPAGRVVAVVVSSGGFLGLGDAFSVVPPTALRYNAEHSLVRLDTTKETLRDAPRFKAGEWPDFSRQDYSEGVYRAYHVEPYFTRAGDPPPDADNAARNARDQGNHALTAADQGNSPGDIKITQEIRRAVVATDGLSVSAKNVKIITVDSRVTLRGPVATAAEKTLIGEIAARAAHVENVDNQLEVIAR